MCCGVTARIRDNDRVRCEIRVRVKDKVRGQDVVNSQVKCRGQGVQSRTTKGKVVQQHAAHKRIFCGPEARRSSNEK